MESHLLEPGNFAWELTNISSSSFHQTMWIERTTYTTAYTFPGILKWFEVKQISTVSHLKLELRKVFPSPNIIRAFVKSPPLVLTSSASLFWQLCFPEEK